MGHGGGKYPPVLIDPAVEKWYFMKENTHAFFKLDRRTTFGLFILTVALPGFWYWGSSHFKDKVKLAGTRRGEQWYFPSGKPEQ